MTLSEAFEEVVDADNLTRLGSVLGGYVVTDQVTHRLVNMVESNFDGFKIWDEVDGLVTGAAFYGYGDMLFSEDTADHMAYGALVHSTEQLADRLQRNGVLPAGGN